MKSTCIDFRQTGKFPSLFNQYLEGQPELAPFYGLFPQPESFLAQIAQKQGFTAEARQVLYQALGRQYAHLANPPQLALDLLLQPNTFTITTGHQLNIFTGPLYFHYKIITVINAAKQLRRQYPAYHFIPVYWMASEDHDAEEISSFRLFGKKYYWESGQKGAVGRFVPHSLAEVVRQTPEMESLFARAYAQSATLAEATRFIVNELYASEGLVVVDGDDADLKRAFAPAMRQELLHQPSFPAMNAASAQLAALGHPAQVHPREINLFYLRDQLRERIVREGADGHEPVYQVLNTSLRFSGAAMLTELEQWPERFSPNVVLRPVYQETILPNLAYTGGPGELAYWLQLKPVFGRLGVPYPILLPRNCALVLTPQLAARMAQLGLSVADLFADLPSLKKRLVAQRTQQSLELDAEALALEALFAQVAEKAGQADQSLVGMVGAEKQRALRGLAKVDKRVRQAQEQKAEVEIGQLTALLDKLFPGGGLQERTDNYLNFALNQKHFLREVMATLDPFNLKFYVLELE
jgi:bacillithiol biosynthesis cysteine-adding enzyme BshC